MRIVYDVRTWVLILFVVPCLQRSLFAQFSCEGIYDLTDRIDNYLSSNVAAIPLLEEEIDTYAACLADPDQKFLQSYGQALLDLAFTMYQRTEYAKAVEWSGRAVALVNSHPEAWGDQTREDILLEYCFYLYWNGNQSTVRQILTEVPHPKSAFIRGLLVWNLDGTQWQQADSLFDLALRSEAAFSPRLENELVIWKAQNLLYSTTNEHWQEAYLALMHQLQRVRKNGNIIAEIWIRYQLGFWGRTTGNSVVFAEQFREVLRLNDQITLWPKTHPFRIRIVNALAVAMEQAGDLYTATLYIDEALDYHRSRGETLLLARRQLNKAKILRSQGQLDEVIAIYESIIPVFKKSNRIENAYSSLNNLANALSEKGDFERALNVSNQALKLKITEKGPSHDDVAIGYINLGHIYHRMGALDQALAHWNKAEDILQSLDRRKGTMVSTLFNSIGSLHLEKQEILMAQNYFEKALAAVSLGTDLVTTSEVDPLDFVSGPTEFLSAQLNLAKVHGARVAEFPEVYHVSDSLFRFCVNYLEKVRFRLVHDQAKEAFQEQAVLVYDAAIRFHLKYQTEDNIDQLFDLFERSKSYALKNQVQERTIAERHHIPKKTLLAEQQLQVAINRLQHQMTNENNSSDSLRAPYFAAQGQLREFQNQIKVQYPGYYLEKYENKSDTLIALQERLALDEFVLIFHLLEQNLLCLRIGKQNKELIQIEIDSNFEEDIEDFLSMVSNFKVSFTAIAERLSEKSLNFMPRLLQDIPENSEIIIVPHKVLASLPFEILMTSVEPVQSVPIRNFPYLFKRFTVRYAFNAGSIRSTSQDLKPMNYLGVAPMCCMDSIPENSKLLSRGVPILPYSADEVRMSAKAWHGNTMFSAQATKRRFLSETAQYNILHLATHGIIDHNQPLYQTRLLFYDDELSITPDLYLHELYQLNLGAQLAVLSACNTGIGPHQTGEGMLSLARAFRYANCPNVVTSLWSVNDESTSRIMTLFFQFLSEGKGITSALSSAKTEFLRTVPTESEYHLHPYFWAGFIAIGDNQVLMPSASYQALWYSLLIILIVGLILWAVLVSRKSNRFPGMSKGLPG